ncbi:MAG: DEAD/DEAH box helicase family protein [Planctomycetes bacterium]|nr:DEAD/DEAH box helicase family protein [Planctomycetota bacterium]
MVDFSKRLGKRMAEKPTDPIQIYDTLDRASDKGPLRDVQREILSKWYKEYRSKKDVILKLHTGQGKTLIGLLILQSRLNEKKVPVLYLCPNNFLVNQTCLQASQFGIDYCTAENDLPDKFIDSSAILITSVQKLFNGLTKFHIGTQSISVSALLMDDSHACIDAIRDSLIIRLNKDNPAYHQIIDLFTQALESQGAGTFADIKDGNIDALLPVPYWEWHDRQSEVVEILSKQKDKDSVKFTWPIIKDRIQECQCMVSGGFIEISPYIPPLDMFGTYWKAEHRVFMSATVLDDSFLIKGLRLESETIKNPLILQNEKWSGEKMILIPSLIDESLDRTAIVNRFGKPKSEKPFGIVVLASSFKNTRDWEACGTKIATKETIHQEIENLRKGNFEAPLALVNRYDGIDLPDKMCRVLVFDSKPYFDNLIDRYLDSCRSESNINAIRTMRIIEQGLGRSVRGEKDYCVIVMIGSELIKVVRVLSTRKYLSKQTQAQIELGLEIAQMAKEEIDQGGEAFQALVKLINQCLKRDPDWKAFYVEKMNAIDFSPQEYKILEIFEMELNAEVKFQQGDSEDAVSILQNLIDKYIKDSEDKGWYLQEMARYTYIYDKLESNKLQVEAHRKNRFLMKPRTGMYFDPIVVVSQRRTENMIGWIKAFTSYEELSVTLEDILSCLRFGVKADSFEHAFDKLGKAMGFPTQRPDKEWKEGPDNLWGIHDGEYLLVECKSEVVLDRAEINKKETGQMNNACAWFVKKYPGAKATKIMIIPTNKVNSSAGFNDEVKIMREKELGKLTKSVKAFFTEFKNLDFNDLSERKIQKLLNVHKLSVDDILKCYITNVRM